MRKTIRLKVWTNRGMAKIFWEIRFVQKGEYSRGFAETFLILKALTSSVLQLGGFVSSGFRELVSNGF